MGADFFFNRLITLSPKAKNRSKPCLRPQSRTSNLLKITSVYNIGMSRQKFIKEKNEEKPEDNKNQADLAYWAYFQLGESRTLNKVAKRLHIPLGTIQYWARKYKWTQRIKDDEDLLDNSTYEKKMASLANIAQIKTFALYMSILEDEKAKQSDKIKAAEKLQALVEKSSQLKDLKKIAIRFPNIENFKEKLKAAGVRVIEKDVMAR